MSIIQFPTVFRCTVAIRKPDTFENWTFWCPVFKWLGYSSSPSHLKTDQNAWFSNDWAITIVPTIWKSNFQTGWHFFSFQMVRLFAIQMTFKNFPTFEIRTSMVFRSLTVFDIKVSSIWNPLRSCNGAIKWFWRPLSGQVNIQLIRL